MAYFVSEKKEGVIIVRFGFSEISLSQREELKMALKKLLNGDSHFVFNLSRLGFLSSLVIATIVFFAKEIRAKNGDVKLCSLSPESRNVASIVRLDKIFEIFEQEKEALDSFKR
jgi:anti-anti-sigma factor